MMAGSTLRGGDILRAQAADIARAAGADQAAINRIAVEHRAFMDAVPVGATDEVLTQAIRKLARPQIDALPKAQRKMIGDPD